MKETFFAILKWTGIILKKVLVIGFCFWVATTLIDLKKEIYRVQSQNKASYDIQAQVFSGMINAIQVIAAFTQEVAIVDSQRAETIAKFLQDLEAKIKAAEEASLNRDKVIAAHIEAAEQKPEYEYLKSMTVYIVQEYKDTEMVSIGTGSIIKVTDTEDYILTNKHVCDFSDGNPCYVYQDKEKYELSLVKKPEVDHDMQVVKTSKVLPNKQAVKGIKDVEPQDKVFMVGNNNGNPFMYSEGTVSGFTRGEGDLLVGMPSGPGNSGSGVFTQDGYLAGLLFAGQLFPSYPFGAAMDTSHGICVNSTVLRLFLAEYIN